MTYTYLKDKEKAKKRGKGKCSTNGLKSKIKNRYFCAKKPIWRD